MIPPVGFSRPTSMLMVVDLPAPFVPKYATNAPWGIAKSSWLTAILLPYFLVKFLVVISISLTSVSIVLTLGH
ncbi:hypothetical protein JOD26_000626 [Limosilactobacillus caviae]